MNPRKWSKPKRVAGVIVGLFVILIIIGAATGSNTSTNAKKGSSTTTSADTRTGGGSPGLRDAHAEAYVNQALRVIAQQREDFHSYAVLTPRILGNLDHNLRSVSSLRVSSTKTTFSVAVTSGNGITFRVNGSGTKIDRICMPSGGSCSGGHWPGGSTLAMPAIPKLTASDKAAVRSILLDSVNHYATLLREGQQSLGSTQYLSAMAGVAAFNNPNSAASKFSAYRKHPDPATDLSYLKAFQKADHYFTAANEPAAIRDWQTVMSNAQSKLSVWVNDAVSWQIKQVSAAKLDADAARVEQGLAKAKADALKASSSLPLRRDGLARARWLRSLVPPT